MMGGNVCAEKVSMENFVNMVCTGHPPNSRIRPDFWISMVFKDTSYVKTPLFCILFDIFINTQAVKNLNDTFLAKRP